MPITIAQLFQHAGPAALTALHKPSYRFTSVRELPRNPHYSVSLYDRESYEAVNYTWSKSEEEELVTERQKIEFVKLIIEKMVANLDVVMQGLNVPLNAQQGFAFNLNRDWLPENERIVNIPTPAVAQIEDEVRDVDFGED